MKPQHLRNYLLFCAYSILPGYLICRHTPFGFLFPYAISTTTTIVAAFLAGGILYASSLIYAYFSSTGFVKRTPPWKSIIIWLVLLGEWLSPFVYVGPFHAIMLKAKVYDSRRTGHGTGWGSATEINNFYEKHPFAAKFILGAKEHALATEVSTPERVAQYKASMRKQREQKQAKERAEVDAWWAKEQAQKKSYTRYDPADALEPPAEPSSPVTTPIPEAPRRQTSSPAPVASASIDTNGYRLSAINQRGAVLNGRYQTWGTMGDGSVLAPNADYTGVTITTPSKEVITLVMKVE